MDKKDEDDEDDAKVGIVQSLLSHSSQYNSLCTHAHAFRQTCSH